MKSLRLLIVDDHQLISETIKKSVDGVFNIQHIDIASSVTDAKALLDQAPYDIALVDICLSGEYGYQVIEYIVHQYPNTRVIAMSAVIDQGFHKRSIDLGAIGFISKGENFSKVLEAIQSALNGIVYLPEEILDQERHAKHVELSYANLSKMQQQLLYYIASGYNKEHIQAEMNIKPRTYNDYRQQLLKTLSLETDAQLTRLAIKKGLVSL